MKRAGQPRRSLWAIFRFPILLGFLSIVGLVSALVGNAGWDVLSWITLGVPIAVIAWFILTFSRRARSRAFR